MRETVLLSSCSRNGGGMHVSYAAASSAAPLRSLQVDFLLTHLLTHTLPCPCLTSTPAGARRSPSAGPASSQCASFALARCIFTSLLVSRTEAPLNGMLKALTMVSAGYKARRGGRGGRSCKRTPYALMSRTLSERARCVAADAGLGWVEQLHTTRRLSPSEA